MSDRRYSTARWQRLRRAVLAHYGHVCQIQGLRCTGYATTVHHLVPSSRIPPLWRSCTNYNKRYPHGVGRLRARDRTRGGTPPVTTFRRSTRIYNIAMSYNRGLDRDKDGVACEKR
jgi:hypothetical protein